jgi:hypothetical protein
MAEQQQPSAAPAATPAAPAVQETKLSPTEQVYKEFGIEEQAASFQPENKTPAQQTTQAPQQPQAFKAPDPFDPSFPAYQAQLANGVTSLNQALQATRTELGTLRQELHHERTEADIKRAVGTIAEKSGLDPKFAEVAFQLRAKEDPRLLQIWTNRSKNPAALSKALEAVAAEFKQTYSVKQDPQLAENQRAIRASQQQMATTTKETENEKWASMTPADRQREVQKMLRMGGR